jgi:uncharacterized membrane protein
MKALALMTVIFLPGTLVSGLFSTPLIERSSGDSYGFKIWAIGFILYLGLSVSLMLVVLVTWGLWLNKMSVGVTNRPILRNLSTTGTTEVGALALKRASTLKADFPYLRHTSSG